MNTYCPSQFWKGKRILFGITGGISAFKVVGVISHLVQSGATIRVIMTNSAKKFIGENTFSALTRNPVYSDLFECGEQILHISLVRESDHIVVAPATANIIGKMGAGIADDLLSSCLCVDPKKVVLIPAMNVDMWKNPIVQDNIQKLVRIGVKVITPDSGSLACGEKGVGRFPEQEDVIENLYYLFHQPQSLQKKRILITAGPTREMIDPIRYLSNTSSGFMGCALAAVARAFGAHVTLIGGPMSIRIPADIDFIPVVTGSEMLEKALEFFHNTDICIMNAAVSDFKPSNVSENKIKKQGQSAFQLSFIPTTDILFELGQRKNNQLLIGFCAENADIISEARRKMEEKNCDLMIANLISPGESGFDSQDNKAWLLYGNGEVIDIPLMNKIDLAELIMTNIASSYFQ